jgi:hypothetical protein
MRRCSFRISQMAALIKPYVAREIPVDRGSLDLHYKLFAAQPSDMYLSDGSRRERFRIERIKQFVGLSPEFLKEYLFYPVITEGGDSV